MNDEMKVAYIRAQILGAEARITGMMCANLKARAVGNNPPYGMSDFENVPIEFGVTHNQVIGYFTERDRG